MITLQGTNISPKEWHFEDDFPNFPRWDMLIPWRVFFPANLVGKNLSGLSSDRLYIPPALVPAQKVEPLCDLALTHGGQGRVKFGLGD